MPGSSRDSIIPKKFFPSEQLSEETGTGPGKTHKKCLNDLRLSVANAANRLGATRQQVHQIVTEKSENAPDMAIHPEKAFGSKADTWLTMQGNDDARE